jgi:enamine deaminase RidA (YjgF/YER057c/UK114 family)
LAGEVVAKAQQSGAKGWNDRVSLPSWVSDRVGPCSFPNGDGRSELEVVQQGPLVVVGGRLPDAAALNSDELRTAVAALYDRIRETLEVTEAKYPVRLWNFIPTIHEPMGSGLTRYMVFNAGRYESLRDWLGGSKRFPESIPTSTGVGHPGRDLLVFCMGSAVPGQPNENPRQHPAYRYSTKYGPLPPCFARATQVQLGESAALLIGGTASVRGEESVHIDRLDRQIEETVVNLEALVSAAAANRADQGPEPQKPNGDVADLFREMRVYHVDAADAEAIREVVESRFAHLRALEMVQADLCRSELLVEIEAVADLDAIPVPSS